VPGPSKIARGLRRPPIPRGRSVSRVRTLSASPPCWPQPSSRSSRGACSRSCARWVWWARDCHPRDPRGRRSSEAAPRRVQYPVDQARWWCSATGWC